MQIGSLDEVKSFVNVPKLNRILTELEERGVKSVDQFHFLDYSLQIVEDAINMMIQSA